MTKISNKISRFFSQRTDGYNGGIPDGMSTFDVRTKKTDELTKQAAVHLSQDPDIETAGIKFRKEFSTSETGGTFVCRLDGGVWEKNCIILGIAEGKKQGPHGNAFERWFKNHDILRYNNGRRSLTFCTGEGVRPSSTMFKEISAVLVREGKNPSSVNIVHSDGCSFFTSENGFSYREIYDTMKQWLLKP